MEVYLSVMEKSPASQNICAHKGLIGNVGCRHLVLRKKPMHLFFYVCPVNGRTVSQAHSCKGTGVFFFSVLIGDVRPQEMFIGSTKGI